MSCGMSITLEYIVALSLAMSCQNNPSCYWIAVGQRYESLSPTQNPNWCVINRGKVASPVRMTIEYKMFMGPGVEPCDARKGPNAPLS